MKTSLSLLPTERIENKIFFIRGRKVMLDRDLAEMYGVETKKLNRAVKRNLGRFPTDFMFQLTKQESVLFSRYQIGTLRRGGNIKYLPFAFTEQGIAMLSSVLNSEQAVQVNIQIIRTFTKIRELIVSSKELRDHIEKLERKYDGQFRVVFDTIKKLITPPKEKPHQKMGFWS
jgi:phage regulator Rha-like protein